jgi:hypothetical protein
VTKPVIEEVVKEVEDPAMGKVCPAYAGNGGCGGGPDYIDDPYWTPPELGDGGLGDPDGGYTLDQIGPYQVLRANPTTTAELTAWLTDLNYLVMPDDVAAVAPYIVKGYTIVALRVALDDTTDGDLAPIALTWAGSEIRLPVKLGSQGAFPMTVYIAADHRYDLPGASVPFAYRVGYDDARYLTRNEYNFDPTAATEDPVAIQVMGDPEKREIVQHVTEKHVPVLDDSECGCGGGTSDRQNDGCLWCSAPGNPRPDWAVLFGAIVFTIIPRRRRRRRR